MVLAIEAMVVAEAHHGGVVALAVGVELRHIGVASVRLLGEQGEIVIGNVMVEDGIDDVPPVMACGPHKTPH